MEFKVWDDPGAFSERVLPELMKREAEHSLMIGILGNIQRGVYSAYHQLTVEDDGQLLAIMQVTPPHPLNYVIVDASRAQDVHETAIEDKTLLYALHRFDESDIEQDLSRSRL